MPTPEWVLLAERIKRGGTPGWGGYRPGAGRPPKKRLAEDKPFNVKLNNIQRMSLQEMGNGDIEAGIQSLIDKYL
jgi:hypothetical protein